MVYSYLFLFCYLEHLDSLRLGHAERLMSWVGLKDLFAIFMQRLCPAFLTIFFLSTLKIPSQSNSAFSAILETR